MTPLQHAISLLLEAFESCIDGDDMGPEWRFGAPMLRDAVLHLLDSNTGAAMTRRWKSAVPEE